MNSGVNFSLPRVPVGLFGEVAVAQALEALGFTGEMHGGGVKWSDGIASREALMLDVQVKCTSKPSGAVHWAKPGGDAREYARYARANGRIAVFIFAHAIEVHHATARDGGIWLPRPEMKLHATTADQFADDVDAARVQYGREPYLRGPNKGELKPETGLSFPVCAGEYPELPLFVDELAAS